MGKGETDTGNIKANARTVGKRVEKADSSYWTKGNKSPWPDGARTFTD